VATKSPLRKGLFDGAGSRSEAVADAEGDASGIGTRSGGDAAQIPDITSQTKANKSISQDLTHKNPSLAPFNNPHIFGKVCLFD